MHQNLLKYYPSLTFLENDSIPSEHEAFYDNGKIFTIHKDDLTEKEIMLLKELYPFQETTPWMNYLLHEGTMTPTDYAYHLIHIKMDKINESSDLWLSTFISFFDKVEDVFSLSDDYHVCVVKSEGLSDLDLDVILQTLHEDIGIYASLYIGDGLSVSVELVETFQEDLNIFRENSVSKRINEFKDIYLNHYVAPSLNQSNQMKHLRSKIKGLKDGVELVEVLWACQGNITQAATILFLHRNTLNYRLDKFQEETGLSLREMKDLQLAYFSII